MRREKKHGLLFRSHYSKFKMGKSGCRRKIYVPVPSDECKPDRPKWKLMPELDRSFKKEAAQVIFIGFHRSELWSLVTD